MGYESRFVVRGCRIACALLIVTAVAALWSMALGNWGSGAASAAYYGYGTGCQYVAGYCPPAVLTTNPKPVAGPTGSAFRDEATLIGDDPTGTITFRLYGPGDPACQNPPAFTSVVVVDHGSGTYVSGAFTPSHSQFGTYEWTADYSGDANNNPASSPCGAEPITVVRVPAHFLGYDVDRPTPAIHGEDVVLEDQFGSETVHRGQAPQILMTPVEKRRQGKPATPILRPDEHLKCWRLTGGARQDKSVRVSNQFVQNVELFVKEPTRLCAPALKSLQAPPTGSPSDTQHYKCYRVEERPLLTEETVDLIDQFGPQRVVVRRAELLCNPVTKERGAERVEQPRPDEHLVCYGVNELARFRARNVFTRDQFGSQRIRVFDPIVLCVPSTKT